MRRVVQADRFKEEISWLKALTGGCAAVEASLIGWLVRNYERDSAVVTLAMLGVLAIGAIIVGAVRGLYRCFQNLESAP